MKRFTVSLFVVSLLVSFMSGAFAQDIMDVEPGFETLNLAIEGDTLPGGVAANPNRIYRLQRNGYYLINGSLDGNEGATLRIVAAEGEGHRPVLIGVADESGESSRLFRVYTDAFWQGIHLSGIDNLGNQVGNNALRLEKEGGRYEVDDVVIDGDAQCPIRIDADEISLFVTNCQFSNSYLLSDPANGRFMDTRGNLTDTIFVQNCTFFLNTHDILRNGGGIVKYLVWDHVTLDKAGGWHSQFEAERNIYCQFSNNIVMNYAFEGREFWVEDSTGAVFALIDSLDAPELATEEEREYQYINNVKGYSDDIKAWIDAQDSLMIAPWMDPAGEIMWANGEQFVFENNIEENVEFTDAPANDKIIAFAQHRLDTDQSDVDNPDIRADKNGVSTLQDDPTTFDPSGSDFDFSYSTELVAYTHAAGGFPAGDLNWFPDKKAEWVAAGMPTAVKNNYASIKQNDFELTQNYPNPFNPTTTIDYKLNVSGDVELAVFNSLGQEVRSLVAAAQNAGSHSITWDSRDNAGNLVPSGLYIYRLQVGGQVESHKMLLMK